MNQVDIGNEGQYRRDEYQEAHQTYVVFTTEATDKKSLQRRAMEVNAVMTAVPKFMHWSEQEISWSRRDTPGYAYPGRLCSGRGPDLHGAHS